MPIYTYICQDCQEKFDLLVGVNTEKIEYKCKKCNSKNIQKTLTLFGVNSAENKCEFKPTCPSQKSCSGCCHGA